MAYEIVTDRETGRKAFESLKTSFTKNAREYPEHSVGWQSNSGRFDVYWHDDLGVWGLFEPTPPGKSPRFWNCFGVHDPADHSMLSITVEINPPHQGASMHNAGAFLRDTDGRLLIAHSGKVGGGRKGIGMKAFRDYVRANGIIEPWQVGLYPDGRERMLYIVSSLDAADLAGCVADFVHLVARFKVHAVHGG